MIEDDNSITSKNLYTIRDTDISANHVAWSSIKLGEISISLKDGKITFPEGMEVDEVSKQIWDGLSKYILGNV